MKALIDTDKAQETRYETPTFSPSSAFARTLRGGEMARRGRLGPTSSAPRVKRQFNGTPRRYQTPTFDPRGAFAWTLRGGEMARQKRPPRTDASADILARAA
jgi:hypothetical protein